MERTRPHRTEYYMGIALAVRARANCLGSRVGAVLVRQDRIVSTGYNGTPAGMKNCDEGGCERCARRERFEPGQAYDLCICVHAEQNTLLSAARFGIAVEGAFLFTTMKPCFGCAKELLQARVQAIYYLHHWEPKAEFREQYERLGHKFPGGMHRVAVDDPDASWAVAGRSTIDSSAGHTLPEA